MKIGSRILIKRILKKFDIGITRYSNLEKIERGIDANFDIEFLGRMPPEHVSSLLNLLKMSESQLRQDLFVLSELDLKSNGYFVEFGAGDGIHFSNTYLLENELGWNGIVAEPAKCWHGDLRKNRNCVVDTSCIWKRSGAELVFNETTNSEISTIDSYSSRDFFRNSRKNGRKYQVTTTSLLDLLEKNRAPEDIDYLSIDTEGSEFDILSGFDFGRYIFSVITCEHNFTSDREKIRKLLASHGYVRKFDDISKFDDWYVKA